MHLFQMLVEMIDPGETSVSDPSAKAPRGGFRAVELLDGFGKMGLDMSIEIVGTGERA